MKARPTGTRLDPILEAVREAAAARRRGTSLEELRRAVRAEPARRARFVDALRGAARADGLALIAECKRRSPSAGALAEEGSLEGRAHAYAGGGAAALSILTEERHFDGHPADLAAVAGAGLPRLRKDFLLDEGMVLESVDLGADAGELSDRGLTVDAEQLSVELGVRFFF